MLIYGRTRTLCGENCRNQDDETAQKVIQNTSRECTVNNKTLRSQLRFQMSTIYFKLSSGCLYFNLPVGSYSMHLSSLPFLPNPNQIKQHRNNESDKPQYRRSPDGRSAKSTPVTEFIKPLTLATDSSLRAWPHGRRAGYLLLDCTALRHSSFCLA